MTYSTKNKTAQQVMKETKVIIDSHEVTPEGKLYYFKKYKDCTAILEDKKGNYYVNELFSVYGTFKTFKECSAFRTILAIHAESHTQLMHASWKSEGANFCKPVNQFV